MAKANWSCSSSSPLVWGRACSRSEAARGDEDDATGKRGKQWVSSLWEVVQDRKIQHSRGGLIWKFSGPRCSIDNLSPELCWLCQIAWFQHKIFTGDLVDYNCVLLIRPLHRATHKAVWTLDRCKSKVLTVKGGWGAPGAAKLLSIKHGHAGLACSSAWVIRWRDASVYAASSTASACHSLLGL